MSDNSAFISYRRSTGYPWARLIWDELQERSIDVFLDLETMRQAGRFDHRILHQIAARPYFLTVLTEGTLERCAADDDWVRREIEYAIEVDRIVVPLFIPPFEPSAFPEELPPAIGEVLANSNGVTFYSQFVREAFDQLAALLTPVDLDQAELTEEDAEFQALAETRVRAEPVEAPAPLPPPPPRSTVSPDAPADHAAEVDEPGPDPATDSDDTIVNTGSTWTVYQPGGDEQPASAEPDPASDLEHDALTGTALVADSDPDPASDLEHDAPTGTALVADSGTGPDLDTAEPPPTDAVAGVSPGPAVVTAGVVADPPRGDATLTPHADAVAAEPEPLLGVPQVAADPGPPATAPDDAPRRRWVPVAAGFATVVVLGGIGLALAAAGDDDDDRPDVVPTTVIDDGGGVGVSALSTADGNGYVTAESPLTSENGRHELEMTPAGRLVLRTDGVDVWSPSYVPVPGAVAILQEDDGNFAVYPSLTATTADDVLWAIGLVPGNPVEMSVIEEGGEGFVVLTLNGSEVWRRGAPIVSVDPSSVDDQTDAAAPDDAQAPDLMVVDVIEDPDRPALDIEFENLGGEPGAVSEIQIDVVNVSVADSAAGTSPPSEPFDVGAELLALGTCLLEPGDLGWDPIAPTNGEPEVRSITFGGIRTADDLPDTSESVLELSVTLTLGERPGDIVTREVTVGVPSDPAGPRDGSAAANC